MNKIIKLLILIVSNAAFAQVETKKDTISTKLEEITIKTTAKTFTYKNGNIKVDIANSIFNSVSNTIDLLSKLPNILINSDKKTISVIGKGNPLIYIDNQSIGINDLNLLAVDDIKSIEIINNPSSKYEANGRVVILIIRKLSKKEGFKIDFRETASIKKRFNNYLGVNASIKKNKVEWKVNFNYNQLNIWEKHNINYQVPEASIISNYDVEAYTERPQFVFGNGMFYKINDDDYFSFNTNARIQKDFFRINTQTFNKQKTIENNVLTSSDNNDSRNFINSFFNYSKKMKSINTQWFSGFQYSRFNKKINTLVKNNFNNTLFELSQNRDQEFDVSVLSGRTDIEKTFKNEMKLEIGGLILSANAKTNFNVFDMKTNAINFSNYNFKEQNNSVYSQLSGKIKKINYSLGFRIENTNVLGKFENDINPLVEKNILIFFQKPSLISEVLRDRLEVLRIGS